MNFKTKFLRNIFVFSLLFILNFAFFYKSLDVFFAQDDFILINEFSSENLIYDLKNTVDPSKATHWRPLHNLYFLISGNLFGKFYPGYHAFSIMVQIASAFMIFKVLKILTKNADASLLGTLVYA